MSAWVVWRGHRLDRRTIAMIEEAERIAGFRFDLVQGGWNSGGVAASAGTHDGAAADFGFRGVPEDRRDAMVAALRRVGFAAWYRRTSQGFSIDHCHAVPVQPGGAGDRGVLSSGAHSQVKDYYNGLNGLAGRGKDDGPRQWVGVTWEKYQGSGKEPEPEKKEDDDMILVSAPNRGVALAGAGFFKVLNSDEQVNVLLAAGIRSTNTNERGFDVLADACKPPK